MPISTRPLPPPKPVEADEPASGSGKKSRQFNFAVDVAAAEPVVLQEHNAYTWTNLTEEPPVTDAVKQVLARYRES
ncbi:hypothetical protein [Nocardia mexicana]|uniref:Uncharacterized protein n=1 Tax=Nocardia mexicana TaxID=279262 RepID=A0A370GHN3_9NOCA|nr:hypothetical protein [Nocardia mexicana]RDI43318.1 hypothetical protein DFR68_12281 [Nocardia mexicana]